MSFIDTTSDLKKLGPKTTAILYDVIKLWSLNVVTCFKNPIVNPRTEKFNAGNYAKIILTPSS